jgi:hypothetical protein
LIALLSIRALLAQQSQTNTTSGACDQTINDNRGVITITCTGIDRSLMEQLKKTADFLDRVARRQTDPAILAGIKDINTKMDEVLSDTRELKTTVNAIQDRNADWVLSKDQSRIISSFLKATGKSLTVPAFRSLADLRSKAFFEQLSDAITKGGWNVTAANFHLMTSDAAGVFIGVKDTGKPAPEGALLLQRALTAAGISSAGWSESDLAEGAFELYVGQKPTGEPQK